MKIEEVFDLNNEWIDKYFHIINNRRVNTLNKEKEYCEKHHVICKFIFKEKNEKIDNSEENLVNLTFKEHIMCHWYLLKYYESINDTLNYEKCAYTLHRMINVPKHNRYLSRSIEDVDFNILTECRKKYSEIMKSKKILLGKIQIYDSKGKVKYIKKEELDDYVNKGYVSRETYYKNEFQKYFDVIEDKIKNNTSATIPELYEMIRKSYPDIKYNDMQFLFKIFEEIFNDYKYFINRKKEIHCPKITLSDEDRQYWKSHNIFEIKQLYDYKLQDIANFKKHVLNEKVNYVGNTNVSLSDIDYIKSHSVSESAKHFQVSYKEMCLIRMELRIKRDNKRKLRKTKTKSQIMKEHHQNDVLLINLDTKIKKFVNKNDVDSFLSNNYMKYDEYLIMSYHSMMIDVIDNGYEHAVEKYDYNSGKRCLMALFKKYFSNEVENIDKAYLVLFDKKIKRNFTEEEKSFMETHSLEECLKHIKNHDASTIRHRMVKKRLIKPEIIYASKEQDEILRTNSIENAMKKLNWSRQKVMTRRYALGILQNTRIRFTPEEDEIIINNTINKAVELTGRTRDSIKRRRIILKRAK